MKITKLYLRAESKRLTKIKNGVVIEIAISYVLTLTADNKLLDIGCTCGIESVSQSSYVRRIIRDVDLILCLGVGHSCKSIVDTLIHTNLFTVLVKSGQFHILICECGSLVNELTIRCSGLMRGVIRKDRCTGKSEFIKYDLIAGIVGPGYISAVPFSVDLDVVPRMSLSAAESGAHCTLNAVQRAEICKALGVRLTNAGFVHCKTGYVVCPHIINGSNTVVLVCVFHSLHDKGYYCNSFIKLGVEILGKQRAVVGHLLDSRIALTSIGCARIVGGNGEKYGVPASNNHCIKPIVCRAGNVERLPNALCLIKSK